MFHKFIKEWYTLNKTQRRGTVLLFLLLISALLFKFFYRPTAESNAIYFANIIISNTSSTNIPSHPTKDSLFFFDPNNIDEYQIQLLPLPKSIIQHIINYRKAGGRFYSRESLKKIYGMNDSIYQKLEPYILIENKNAELTIEKSSLNKFTQKQNTLSVELNSADSIQLEKLKGIGKVLSLRIIKYRNRLGGFYDVKQLKEVYGIQDSLYNFIISKNTITVDTQLIRRIDITTADFKTLIRHPYFSKDMVIKILDLKKSNTSITPEKLKSIVGEEYFHKIMFYIQWK